MSVYPGYIATQAKAAFKKLLEQGDPGLLPCEQILSSVGDMETIGDCRYAITLTDHNGTAYKVTVEVAK